MRDALLRPGIAASALLLAALSALPIGAKPQLEPLQAFVNYEVGQIQNGVNNENVEVDRELINHAAVWTLQEAKLNDHARVRFGVGAAYFFVLPRNLGANPYTHSKRSVAGITEAHGEFDIARNGSGDLLLGLKAGIFGYKYNPDAKNLGEYMYRTWTYPNVITTGGLEFINSAGAQLSGLSAMTRMGGLKNDVLLTIETDRPPIFGLSLTDIVSYDFGGIFEIGAGFMLNNFYTPDSKHAKPTDRPENSYVTLRDGRQMAWTRYDYEVTNGILNPALDPNDSIASTDYYSLAGQKAMVRASANVGKLVGGPLDPLKLYGEVIVLGLKDYPTFYENLSDRVVYMGGVNLPTFGLLDMLSVEVEYAPNPYENTTEGPFGQKSITPWVPDWGSYEEFDEDDIKWTVYARRNVYDGFSINLQVANDHIRMLDQFSTPDFREYMPKKESWYWAVKLAYAL